MVEALAKTLPVHLDLDLGATSHRRPCADPHPARPRTLRRNPSVQLGRWTLAGGMLEPRLWRRSRQAGTLCGRPIGRRSGRAGSLRGGNRPAVLRRGRGERFSGLLGHRLHRLSGLDRPGLEGAMADCPRHYRRCRHSCTGHRQAQHQTSKTGRQRQCRSDGRVRAHGSQIELADALARHFGRNPGAGRAHVAWNAAPRRGRVSRIVPAVGLGRPERLCHSRRRGRGSGAAPASTACQSARGPHPAEGGAI